MDDYFHENYSLLENHSPLIAAVLKEASTDGVSWCYTRSGEENITYWREGSQYYLHSNYSAVKEADSWLSSLDLKGCDLLYVYGIGLGYSYEVLKSWLHDEKQRYLVFLEDDLPLLRRICETERMKELLQDPQVKIFFLPDTCNEIERICEKLSHYFIDVPFRISGLSHYQYCKWEQFQQLRMHLTHKALGAKHHSRELLNNGVTFFRNYYHNLLLYPECHSCSLQNSFPGVPAIICGAGPSLKKNIDVLASMSDRALLFAGGSAINALTGNGIEPTFGGSVDPNYEQFRRMSAHSGYELPMFVVGRAHHKAFDCFHGPKIVIPVQGSYPVAQWIEQQLGFSHDDLKAGGHNIIHVLMEIARYMGCDPIIFVGMDMAFTNMEQYAPAVVEKAAVTKEEITAQTHLNDNAIVRSDIYGEPIYTLWKWVGESSYTAHYASRHLERTFINATEGGLGIDGVTNMTLEEVKRQYCSHQIDVSNRVHSLLHTACDPQITIDDVTSILAKLYQSMEDGREICEEMKTLFEDLMEAVKKRKSGKVTKISAEIEKLQERLESLDAYKEVLVPVNLIHSLFYSREFDQISYDSFGLSDTEKIVQKCEKSIEELSRFMNTAVINIALIRKAVRNRQQQGYYIESFFPEGEQNEQED